MIDIAELRAQLPITGTCTYLNHAAVGPVPQAVARASGEPALLQSQDPARMNAVLADRTADLRQTAARLWGAAPDRVAIVQNTSHGLSLIANGIDWRQDDNIIVSDQEFPSNYLPWLRQTSQPQTSQPQTSQPQTSQPQTSQPGPGAQIRNFPLQNGRLTADTLSGIIDDRTRVVALSHVQFHNGFRADIAAIAEIARAHDALTVIDGTQSLGVMQFDLDAWGADALVFSAHKWMLCPKGIGLMLLSPRALDQIDVTVAGWQSVNDRFAFNRTLDFCATAARFESGTELAPGIFAMARRLQQIEAIGTAPMARRAIDLRNRAADGLRSRGWDITSPGEQDAHSSILTARHPTEDPEAIVTRLEQAGIRTSSRGGALRISPHIHNSEDEIDLLLDHLTL